MLIVEVEGYEGEDGSIIVSNDRALTTRKCGAPDKLYCLAIQGEDGVIRFIDWGYATIEEARESAGEWIQETTPKSTP